MTATLSSPGATRPLVRIRRAPALEPPADDDRRADDHPVCAGQLALFTSVHGRSDNPRDNGPRDNGPRDNRSGGNVPAGGGGAAAARTGPASAQPATGATLQPSASAQVAASRFVATCVEVLNGFRPAGHLRALTTPFEFAAVTTQLTRRAVRLRMPGRAPGGRERLGVRRLRVFEQRAGVAEAVAVLGHGETSWAMALRFEHRRGSWLCTLLEVI
jgi:hypothetical protein